MRKCQKRPIYMAKQAYCPKPETSGMRKTHTPPNTSPNTSNPTNLFRAPTPTAPTPTVAVITSVFCHVSITNLFRAPHPRTQNHNCHHTHRARTQSDAPPSIGPRFHEQLSFGAHELARTRREVSTIFVPVGTQRRSC